MREQIMVIGSLNYDIILQIPRMAKPGETLTANAVSYSAGGKGANQAVQAAKLGTTTYMVGCLGDDAAGQILSDSLANYGVKLDYIRRVQGSSGTGIVNALDNGEVQAYIVRGANWEMKREDVDRVKPLLEKSKVCIVQNEVPAEVTKYAMQAARDAGCIVLWNAAPAVEDTRELLGMADIFVVNEVEAGYYMGTEILSVEVARQEIVQLTKRHNCKSVFTLGKEGAVVYDGVQVTHIPAQPVSAVETTGAGDSFIGGMAHALVRGEGFVEACRFGTRCSAVTVQHYGAQPAMPTLDEL